MGKGEEVFPALFQKLEKRALILGENALIVVIFGLNYSFKMQFLRVSRRRNQIFFPAAPFFLVLYMIVYQSALIPKKHPCPKNFLVMRLSLPPSLKLLQKMKQKTDFHRKKIFANNILATSTVNTLKYLPNELNANCFIANLLIIAICVTTDGVFLRVERTTAHANIHEILALSLVIWTKQEKVYPNLPLNFKHRENDFLYSHRHSHNHC